MNILRNKAEIPRSDFVKHSTLNFAARKVALATSLIWNAKK